MGSTSRRAVLLAGCLASLAACGGPPSRAPSAGAAVPPPATSAPSPVDGAPAWPGRVPPGPATSRAEDGRLRLANAVLAVSFRLDGGVLRPGRATDLQGGATLPLGDELFAIELADGQRLPASALRLAAAPVLEDAPIDPTSPCLAERCAGRRLRAELRDPATGLSATYTAELRDGSNAVDQTLTLAAGADGLPAQALTLVDTTAPGARCLGTVKGSPLVASPFFLGLASPLADNGVDEQGHLRGRLARPVPLRPGARCTVRAVLGVVPPGQLRRGVLRWIELRRAHPYRPFLHYNSWYDIGYFEPYDEQDCLDVVRAFGEELVRRRGVVLDSFLFDDGWDDTDTVWAFHDGLPRGFTRVRAAAEAVGAEPGVWLSPWGGYGDPREHRLAAGRARGLETNEAGFALSGPRYFARFRSLCRAMIEEQGVNQFKFDGVGRNTPPVPGSPFGSDFEAAIALIDELRGLEPDLYVNLTTGTWPSPFWLLHADSIWRGGYDHEFTGVGTARQRWMTYRDAQTWANVVQAGPLYPLNALMLHGVIDARHARDLDGDPGHDLRDEIRTAFGCGTQLQELYVTPALMSEGDWDDLAAAAKWSRARAETLRDTHWIGGDPQQLQVYGWAAWSPGRAIVVLRNPADRPQAFGLDAAPALELPPGASRRWRLTSPWADQRLQTLELSAGQPAQLTLEPFEVVVLDGVPAGP